MHHFSLSPLSLSVCRSLCLSLALNHTVKAGKEINHIVKREEIGITSFICQPSKDANVSFPCKMVFTSITVPANIIPDALPLTKNIPVILILSLRRSNFRAELSFVTLNIHLCKGLNDKNLVKRRKTCFITV